MLRPASALVLALACVRIATAAEDAAAAYQARVQPLLATYCTRCHGTEKQKAKISFAGARGADQLAGERELWFRALDQVDSREMPPENEKQPSSAERAAIAAWIRGSYTDLLLARQRKEGRARFRRLSRNEYADTVLDLFGIRPAVGINLPSDGRVDGYDKLSAALPLSAAGAAGYFRMSEDLLKWVLRPLPKPKAAPAPAGGPFDPARTTRAAAMESGQSPGHTLKLADGTMVSFNSDFTSGRLDYQGARNPGMHRLRISVYGYQTDKPMAFGIYAGHTSAYPQLIDLVKVLEAPPGAPAVIETEVYLRTREFNDLAPVSDNIRLVPFGIGVQVPKNSQASACRGPGLAVQWVEIEEPELPLPGDRWLTADFPPALDEELRRSKQVALRRNPQGDQAKSLTREGFLAVMHATFKRVGARFFRRELSAAELERIDAGIAQRVDAGTPLATVFLDQVSELMTAPEFLCVIEPPGQLSDFALASRLSYFLWRSTPDEALLDVARQGRLHDPKVLREQTERLLADAKCQRFVDDFVDQWLGLRAIDDTSPDRKLYPEYGEFLKLSSVMETRGTFRRMLAENLGVRQFVDPRWALVNEDLARHYGLSGVTGAQLRAVDLPEGSPYGGLWTQAAVLKVTANGTSTSPVKRGVWMAERLLGIPIPPPPPTVKPVEPDVRGAKTLREQLALHRSQGSCAACHAKFDPYGFALESFDVVGGFRTAYREPDPEVLALPADQRKGRRTWRDGLPVDCTGTTPAGQAFSGIVQLRQLLARDPEQLARGVTRHLVAYATGAPATAIDQAAIQAVAASAKADGYGLRSLVHALVQSELFRWK
jgi:mono/diheme cytochrome c family protein